MSRILCFKTVILILCTVCLPFSQQAIARSLPDFTPLVEENSAAVVNISTTMSSNQDTGGRQFNFPDVPEGSPFHDFFRKFFEEMPEGNNPYQQRSSLGSGFIISDDGYVISNYHVVKDSDEIIVRLNDRREFTAEIIGSDERSDIALLKIDGKKLPTVKIGDSSKVRVGEWVLAIGTPFGFDHSVTAGIVSAIGRSLPNENYVPFIQTDVAINPGNSGGPLFNLDGEVIGVNSQIYSRTGGFMGLSFAVPINVTMEVYQQLRDSGFVSRGWLGVLIQDVNAELAESFGMKKPQGALVAKVLDDSPASRAGFEVGDIVTRYNGEYIRYSSDLPPMVGISKVGATVPVEIIRHGKSKTLQVTIARLPDDETLKTGSTKGSPPAMSNPLKITVRDLTEEQRDELDLQDHGVIVEETSPGPALDAGIRKGDVITLVNNIRIKDRRHFDKIIESLPTGKSIPVLIQRRGGPIFLALKLQDKEDS